MNENFKQTFIEEMTELLYELETVLIEVEKEPDNNELIAKIFRALHTIKGSSGMFGYDDISMFTHDIESVYDFIRNGKLKINKTIIDLTLKARDMISVMLSTKNDSRKIDEAGTKEILNSFRSIVLDVSTKKNSDIPEHLPDVDIDLPGGGNEQLLLISFSPSQDIFLSGTNPLLLLQELKALGETIILGNFQKLPLFDDFNPEKCYTSWEILIRTDKGIDALKDVFIFVEDQCDLSIEEINTKNKLYLNENFAKFEKFISDYPLSNNYDIRKLLNEFHSSTESKQQEQYKAEVNGTIKETPEIRREAEINSSIRVSAEKLDELVNLVGELVIVQARLSQSAQNNSDQEMVSISEEVERITWSLRDSALNIRMLPIGTTFSKFKRLVRDLSKELGKEVELTTDGAETELDKTVIEKLNDPLVHIIRNSIDHGIETPDLRIKNGKSKTGKVHLSASQAGGNVIVKISDDGAGLDKKAIKEKAVKMGLLAENSEQTDTEIYSMIFAPGFSTAKKVTNVSGRGVGMDVVRRAIENLRGIVEVTSQPGSGTTITLKLPLTLAIIDGLLVKIHDDHFILPLSTVEECVELTKADQKEENGRHLVNIRGGIVPYIILRDKFDIKNTRPDIEQIVIVQIKGNRYGFVVDKVLGQHQTVLKSLGRFYKNIKGVSGATILGDGTVALILDLQKIVENEELAEKELIR